MPFSTAGTNWRGIDPPKMSSTNSKSVPRVADLVLVAAVLRLDRVGQDRLAELDRRETHRVRLVAEDVVGQRVLQLRDRAEIAGFDLGHDRLRLALQQHQVAEPLGRIL